MEFVCSKTNRSLLMGIAIVAITICHINQFIGVHKGLDFGFANEFLYASAAVGVDIFFFFSLVGLGFSLEKNKILKYYTHRIQRIFPAYLLFLLIVLLLFYRGDSLVDKWVLFGQQIFGLSATKYVNQRIEWYVPSILLLYAFYPLFFQIVRWIHKRKHNRVIEMLTLCVSVVTSYIVGFWFVGLLAMRLPLFYLAILSYLYIKDGESEKLDIIYIIAAFCSFVVKNEILSYALIIPLFLYVVNRVINAWMQTKWGNIFSWLGNYTLEIYLAQVIATKYLIKELPTNNVFLIVFAVIGTTALLAFILNSFASFVNNTITYLKGEIDQSYSGARLAWADAAKGLAMLIIMWGHMQHPSTLKIWLTSFHVPLFLVLSGILLSRKVKMGGAKHLANKLLFPYITFSTIAIACYFLYESFFSGLPVGIDVLITNIYKTITGYGILAIWFIPSYFIACYMFSITFKSSIKCQICLLLLWAFIGMVGSDLFVWLEQTITDQHKYNAIYYPMAALLRGLACTFYLVLGRLLFDLFKYMKNFRYFNLLLFVVAVTCFISSIILSQELFGTNFSLLRLGKRPYMNFVCGAVGSIWVIIFFYISRRIYTFPFLQWIGRKSLVIMGTHMSLLLTIIVPIVIGKIIYRPADETIDYYLFGTICVIALVVIEIPIIRFFDSSLKMTLSKRVFT